MVLEMMVMKLVMVMVMVMVMAMVMVMVVEIMGKALPNGLRPCERPMVTEIQVL